MLDKDLLNLLGNNSKYVVYVVLLQIGGLLANLGITAALCGAIYLLLNHSDAILYLYPALFGLLAIALRYLFSRASDELKDRLGRYVKADLRRQTYGKILRLGIRDGAGLNMAGLTQVSIEGIEQLDLYYSTYLPQFFFALIAPLILFAFSVFLDWRVAVTLLAGVPLIPISIVLVSKYAKKIFAKYWGKYTSMGDGFLDAVQGLKELKIFQADEAAQKKMNINAEEFRKITMKVLVMQLASTTIMDLVAYGGAGVGIALAVLGVMDMTLTPAAALFLVLIAVDFFLPLRALGSAFHVAMNGASAGRKIIGLLNLSDPIWGEEEVEGTELSVQNVSFAYEGDEPVLKDVSLDFPSAGLRAIVGESGSGKSTIVNLLLGALRPQSGMVTLGGKPIESLSRSGYYAHVGAVSCDTYLFNMSIADNFHLAKPDVTEAEMLSALQKVNMDEFVLSHGGFDLVLNEEATNLSGGQKQRLALAINLVSPKDVYIFDEATSNIDVESEAIIMDNVYALSKKKSVILISHRLANIEKADWIYYLEEGEVKESGTPSDLLAKQGGFARLYSAQQRLEKGYLAEVGA